MTESTTHDADAAQQPEKHEFQAEVSRLLELVAHSLYSNKEIFLRELISNASDACDKLRYEALTRPELTEGVADLKITLIPDAKARTLTVRDNGIGMNRDDLVDNLGTIARSGTAAFVEALSGDQRKDTSLIGQFGVGFYSAYMVSDSVTVTTRRAGEDTAWTWTSDGKGAFEISPAPADTPRGTTVTLHLKKDQKEFLEAARIRTIVTAYSDHIGLPIMLDEGTTDDGAPAQVNAASALWTRPQSEIDAEQYKEFYHHVGHAFDEPWLTVHNRVEGKIEYTNLLFVPSSRPFDLFNPERKNHVKLYVRRVFITDDCEDLLPGWLRFVRGVVDSEDLPLNISREMLQHNPVLARIRSGLVKRILGELKKKAGKDEAGYAAFWDNFGPVLKEGLYEDNDQRDALLALARFRSTTQDTPTSLADYVARMKDGQDAIFYITGDDAEAVAASPQLEAFHARGVEVLLLTDPVDEFWVPAVASFEDKPFRSATRGDIDLDAFAAAESNDGEAPEKADDGDLASLTALLKLELKDAVKDVRASHRLTDSAVCLVADEGDMDMHLERLLRQHQQVEGLSPRILEINPSHPLIRQMAATVAARGSEASAAIADLGWLLLDQARIVEGEPLPDPAAFARRLSQALEKGLAA